MSKNGSDPYSWYEKKARKEQSPDQPVPSSQGAQSQAPNLPSTQKPDIKKTDIKKQVSARKIEANRHNAHNSTGPRTSRGKEIVSRNAIKHSFFSKTAVLKDQDSGESQQEFDELVTALRDDLQPVGKAEELIVDDIAQCEWRKRRLLRYENGMISDRFSQHRDQIAMKSEHERVLGKDLLRSSPQREAELEARTDRLCMPVENADLILRYLVSIDKQLHRNFALLQQLQSKRQSRAGDACVGSPTNHELAKPQAQMIPEASGTQQSQLQIFRVQGTGNIA